MKMTGRANTREVKNGYLSKSQYFDMAHMTLDNYLPIFRRRLMTISSKDSILRAVQTDYPEDRQQITPICRYLTIR